MQATPFPGRKAVEQQYGVSFRHYTDPEQAALVLHDYIGDGTYPVREEAVARVVNDYQTSQALDIQLDKILTIIQGSEGRTLRPPRRITELLDDAEGSCSNGVRALEDSQRGLGDQAYFRSNER